jgi:hypothetical protein
MKKFIALAAFCSLTIAALYTSSCKGKKSEPQANTKEDSLKKIIERGEYLANHVTICMFRVPKEEAPGFLLPKLNLFREK